MILAAAIIITATVYGYAPAAGGINAWEEGRVTRYGLLPGPSVAACGENWPVGAILEVAGRQVICGDTGAGIRGWDVDLWFATAEAALQHGRPLLPIKYLGKEYYEGGKLDFPVQDRAGHRWTQQ